MRYSTVLSFGLGLGLTLGLVAFGCSAAGERGTFDNTGGSDGEGSSSGQAGAGQGGAPGTGGAGGNGEINFPIDGGGGGPPLLPGEVFGHSSDTLYKLEPYSKQVTVIGLFKGC